MNFYELETNENIGNDPKRSNTDLYSLSEVELDQEVSKRYEAFIESVKELDRVLSRAKDENDSPKYDIKDVVDAIKEAGLVLDKKQKETFIKNVKAGKVSQSMTVNFKDFKGKDQVDLAYKLNFTSWKIAEWREAKEVKEMEKKDYYSQFGEDWL